VEQLGALRGEEGEQNSDGLRARKERGRRDFEDQTKPAPLKPKGAAPSKIKTNSTHSQPLISAPPAKARDTNSASTNSDDGFVSVREGAEMIKLSEISIRRYLTKKKLTRFKVGSRTLLKRSEVLGLVRQQS